MSSSRRRPELRLSISQGRDAREIQLPPSSGKYFLLTSPFIEQIIFGSPERLADAPEIALSAAKGLAETNPFVFFADSAILAPLRAHLLLLRALMRELAEQGGHSDGRDRRSERGHVDGLMGETI